MMFFSEDNICIYEFICFLKEIIKDKTILNINKSTRKSHIHIYKCLYKKIIKIEMRDKNDIL